MSVERGSIYEVNIIEQNSFLYHNQTDYIIWPESKNYMRHILWKVKVALLISPYFRLITTSFRLKTMR